jgi:hypothetical protein
MPSSKPALIEQMPRDDRAPERRKAQRLPFSGKVVVRSSMGEGTVARLRDISPFGCNLLSDADWLRSGRFISVHPARDSTIQAIVRWTRDGSVGVEFLRPIDLAEVDWLEGHGA